MGQRLGSVEFCALSALLQQCAFNPDKGPVTIPDSVLETRHIAVTRMWTELAAVTHKACG